MSNFMPRKKLTPRRRPVVEQLEVRRVLAASTVAFEPVTELLEVADINRETDGLDPQQLTVVGDDLYFSADDGTHGRELWKSDGTAAGTYMVEDVTAGQEGHVTSVAALGELAIFVVEPTNGDIELWKSDGTAEGTSMLRLLPHAPREMVEVAGTLFLSVGSNLYSSDGTPEGTGFLATTQGFNPQELTVVGDTLFFTASTLWKSDGTQVGTQMVKDVQASSLANMDGTLYFAGGTSRRGNGVEPWISDGTAEGTMELKDVAPGDNIAGPSGPRSSRPSDFTLAVGDVYFTAGSDVWRTDGTESGTVKVDKGADQLIAFNDQLFIYDQQRIRLLGEQEAITPNINVIRNVTIASDGFYFSGATPENGREIWKSDGTPTGTAIVSDIAPGPTSGITTTPPLIFQDELFFPAEDGITGIELWRSNGSPATTQPVYDLAKGYGSNPLEMTPIDDSVFFSADDGVTDAAQLWAAEELDAQLLAALPEPQKLFDDLEYPGSDSLGLINFLEFDGNLIFTHHFTYLWASANQQLEYEMWTSDGTAAGTELVEPSYYSFFAEEGPDHGPLYQTVFDGSIYYEYGKYDGQSVDQINLETGSLLSQFTTAGDQLYFSLIIGSTRELWVGSVESIDGEQTFHQVSNFGSDGILRPRLDLQPNFSELVNVGDELYFTAGIESQVINFNEILHVTELWKSDGTSEGTVRVADLSSGHLANLTAVDQRLFFTSAAEPALWVHDETGVLKLQEFAQLGTEFHAWNDWLYFAADNGQGLELWRSDGTVTGTEQVADIMAGEPSSAPMSFATVGDHLYFAANDGITGREIWRTDGTSSGTTLFADVSSGPSSSDPNQLVNAADRLYFTADDGTRGREIWRSGSLLPNIPGDVNDDQLVDATDIDAVFAAIVLDPTDPNYDLPKYDLNEDGELNTSDANFLVTEILQTRQGDADLNGRVEFEDFLTLSRNYGKATDPSWSEGDFDGDGEVAFVDFLLLSGNFGFDQSE